MATKTKTRIGPYTWIPGGTFQDPDATEGFAETCAADCGRPVTDRDDYQYCVDNGEVCHAGCALPTWE